MQNTLVCPSCGGKGMSLFRRLYLSPGAPQNCLTCGKKIGISYAAMLCLLPFLAALYFVQYLNPTFAFLAGTIGTAAMFAICLSFPLKEK